ncbi:MAG: hypothetical protein HC887_08785 [Desulfobacteraceae bacterium]|nr:hypothetical protein [Desulfobacteraceae bacterium]
MKNLPIIRGQQVCIGPMPDTAEFYEAYTSWLNSERVRFGIGDDADYSTAEVAEMLNAWRDDPDNLTFCVYDSISDQPIGDVCIRYGLRNMTMTARKPRIMIGKKFRAGKRL